MNYTVELNGRLYRIEDRGVFVVYCNDVYLGFRRTLEDARVLVSLHDDLTTQYIKPIED